MKNIDDELIIKNRSFIRAFNNGLPIQSRSLYHECILWVDDKTPHFNNSLLEFRIKPLTNK